MITLKELENKVLLGGDMERAEASVLLDAPLDKLCAAADNIRKRFCGNGFDLCSIINGKSGKCGEDCKFCAQSAHWSACAESYPLMTESEILRAAEANARAGIPRFSIVTSGRRLSEKEIESLCKSIRAVKEKAGVSVCASVGLLDGAAFESLRSAGADRAHCNLETSERYFPQICTTHTYIDKINALNRARSAGLEICSGGIMGLGETQDDRIELAFALKDLGVSSVPINFLNPISGTPFEKNALLSDDEKRRVTAIFRFILPKAFIRLAGGRGLIADKGAACFLSGANACITGDMLTTQGISAETDRLLIKSLGYKAFVYKDGRVK